MKESAVSQVARRFKQKVLEDSTLRKLLSKIVIRSNMLNIAPLMNQPVLDHHPDGEDKFSSYPRKLKFAATILRNQG